MGKICSNCGNELSDTAKFCGKCGSKCEEGVQEKKVKGMCQKCGNELVEKMKFCPKCGTEIKTVESRDKSKRTSNRNGIKWCYAGRFRTCRGSRKKQRKI